MLRCMPTSTPKEQIPAQGGESVSSTLRAVDIRLRVGGSTGGLPRWMTAATSIPLIDAAVLMGEPMTASCNAL